MVLWFHTNNSWHGKSWVLPQRLLIMYFLTHHCPLCLCRCDAPVCDKLLGQPCQCDARWGAVSDRSGTVHDGPGTLSTLPGLWIACGWVQECLFVQKLLRAAFGLLVGEFRSVWLSKNCYVLPLDCLWMSSGVFDAPKTMCGLWVVCGWVQECLIVPKLYVWPLDSLWVSSGVFDGPKTLWVCGLWIVCG